MFVSVPGFRADVDIAVAIHVGCLCFVASFSAEDKMLLPLLALAVDILPDEPLVGRLGGERASAGEDIEVAVVVEVGHGQ